MGSSFSRRAMSPPSRAFREDAREVQNTEEAVNALERHDYSPLTANSAGTFLCMVPILLPVASACLTATRR